MYLHYQPIIELDTGICVGAEALVRWQRPDGTQVRPDLFIPLAEEAGMIADVTDLVIENVVRDMRELLVADRSAHIAINLAAEDISSGRALKMISRHMAGSGILPQQIWMEATERGFLDLDRARTMLAAARRAGHSVAIDDFGVGFSSLQYLEQLPLDALKIDKSFIDAIGTESATSPVTPHIIDMARSWACGWWPRAWKPKRSWPTCTAGMWNSARAGCSRGHCRAMNSLPSITSGSSSTVLHANTCRTAQRADRTGATGVRQPGSAGRWPAPPDP